ncbi:MAG: hypothetical protein A2864_01075 [Candidatus Woykebacteria bacterium RIFCSPHIGHO2_01_FULL_39_12]|uniref:Type II secretion system protein GspG C-terminal domain-containing protein n=2 Tax=Candidatus Woykeibacteriota TaxID=1817899 RepID=A0A1G1WD13_9BACT|nr:MAG: hypothetical protein A2134_00640 [Candidatus Woykebacteria bacterium RBG_16_39_9b]OGY27462.1 MAG: hypothetical protein A2864_01075 [Candidatus Woykebacteria bacterium RIFCSPHIGHO2_01_FULL_39_12]
MARGLLISLLTGVLFSAVLFSTLTFTLFRSNLNSSNSNTSNTPDQPTAQGGFSPSEALKEANDVKLQAELKNLSTQMLLYYNEESRYPTSLEELASFSGNNIDISNIKYIRCSDHSAAYYSVSENYPGYMFNYEKVQPYSDQTPPVCN